MKIIGYVPFKNSGTTHKILIAFAILEILIPFLSSLFSRCGLKFSLFFALLYFPFIVLQLFLLLPDSTSYKKFVIVSFLNIDWFPCTYLFLLFMTMLDGMHGSCSRITVFNNGWLNIVCNPFVDMANPVFWDLIIPMLFLRTLFLIRIKKKKYNEVQKQKFNTTSNKQQ